MRHRARRRFLAADIAVVSGVAVLVIVLSLVTGGRSRANPGHSATGEQSFAGATVIPAGFLGLSFEYPAVEAYAGSDPKAIDPVLVRLIRNLAPAQRPVLRIGGDSTDSTWWPVAGVARPPGVTYTLNRQWLAVTQSLATTLGARLILGINLEADDRGLAQAEARALLAGLGPGYVQALELGNEPELYGGFAWYRTADGTVVTGRPRSYGFSAYARDFAHLAQALPAFSLAGPAISGTRWLADLPQFLDAEPRIGLVTVHRYPLQNCFTGPRSPRYPSIEHLLSSEASTGFAGVLAGDAAVAHGRGLPFRLDELNTVSCGGDQQISETFAAALWALDALFELAHAGIDGVNIHTFPGAGYELFRLTHADGRWQAAVSPEYYGLMMFAQAAPPGSRLVRLGGAAGPVKVWATRAPDGRIRVVAINKDLRHAHVATVPRLGALSATATIERLEAPSAAAGGGVTLGGQTFGAETTTGSLARPAQAVVHASAGGGYVVSLPPASAALLTLH